MESEREDLKMKHYETPMFLTISTDPVDLLTASTPTGFLYREEGEQMDEMDF